MGMCWPCCEEPPQPDCIPDETWCDSFDLQFPAGAMREGYLGADHLDSGSPAIFSRSMVDTLKCTPDDASGTLYRCALPIESGTFECGRRFNINAMPYWDSDSDDVGIFVGGVGALVFNRVDLKLYSVPVDDVGRPTGAKVELMSTWAGFENFAGQYRFGIDIREVEDGFQTIFFVGGITVGSLDDTPAALPEFFRAGVYCRNGGEWDDLGLNRLCPEDICPGYVIEGFALDPDHAPLTQCVKRDPFTGTPNDVIVMITNGSPTYGQANCNPDYPHIGQCRHETWCSASRRLPNKNGIIRLDIPVYHSFMSSGNTITVDGTSLVAYGFVWFPQCVTNDWYYNVSTTGPQKLYHMEPSYIGSQNVVDHIWDSLGGPYPHLAFWPGYENTTGSIGRYLDLVPYVGPLNADPRLPMVLTKGEPISLTDPPDYPSEVHIPSGVWEAMPDTVTVYTGIHVDC